MNLLKNPNHPIGFLRLCLKINLFTKANIYHSVIFSKGRAHCFYGDYKNILFLKEYMERAGQSINQALLTVSLH